MNRDAHPSGRWSTQPQLHRCCYWPWSRGTYDLELSWVKDKCDLSSFSALTVIPILWLAKFLIPRYDDSAVQSGGEVEFKTKFATSNQPPGMKHYATLSNSLWSKDHKWAFSYSLRVFCVLILIIPTFYFFGFLFARHNAHYLRFSLDLTSSIRQFPCLGIFP